MLIHAVYGNANNSNASHTGGMSALQIQGVTSVHRNMSHLESSKATVEQDVFSE